MYDEFSDRTTWGPGLTVQRWFIRRVLNSILKALDQDLKDLEILEIGTGLGDFAECVMAGGVKRYVGVEPNQVLRESAQKSTGQPQILAGGLPNLPESTQGQFDLVVLTHVFEHAHESPKTMYVPLVILAVFAVVVGWCVPFTNLELVGLIEQARPEGTAAGTSPGLLLPQPSFYRWTTSIN